MGTGGKSCPHSTLNPRARPMVEFKDRERDTQRERETEREKERIEQ